jgi:hypothetical protein
LLENQLLQLFLLFLKVNMSSKILDALEAIFPFDPDYESKRRWIARELMKENTDPEKNLINFHYTPAGPPFASKEEVLAEIKKAFVAIEKGDYEELKFNDSRKKEGQSNSKSAHSGPPRSKRIPTDVRQLVEDLNKRDQE